MADISITVTLIDDHLLLSESLGKLLRRYEFIKDIQTFKSPEEFLAAKSATEPDIIISDILMPGMSGIDLLTHYKKINKKLKIILLSSIIEVQTIRHAMRNGASGYLAKDTSPDELADAILTVYHGEPYIGESLRKSLIRNSFTEEQFVYNLSPREKEVLK